MADGSSDSQGWCVLNPNPQATDRRTKGEIMRRILCIVSLLLFLAGAAAAQNAYGPGRIDLPLIAGQHYEAGVVTIHNNNGGLLIDVQMMNDWKMVELHVHAGWDGNPVPMKKGNPALGKFDFKYEYSEPAAREPIYLDFDEDLQGFRWGEQWEAQRLRHIAVHADVVNGDNQEEGAWAQGNIVFEGGQWGWWLKYPFTHKKMTHFIDSPVAGLIMASPTEYVYTDESGAAPYFPGESASYYLGWQHLGMTLLDHKVSPLDLFASSDTDDPRVINMAVLLQSLDADADPQPGIAITPEVSSCFNQAVGNLGYISITDWSDDPANPTSKVNLLVDATITNCSGTVTLAKVSPEDAKANLDRSLDSTMFRKNVSKTPDLGSSKAKLNIMGVWFPALRANGDPAVIEYYDENEALIRTAEEAKPIVVTYTDADPVTGAHDTLAAISRDDGNTWKRKNLSRSGDRSSMTVVQDGISYDYPGTTKKPVFQVKGNNILVAWSSKFCKGGRPAYAIDLEDDYIYDDPYYTDDIFGVAGPQRSHDYTEDGFPEVGELPFSCVWAARGTIVTQGMINSGGFWATSNVGDIVWFKPERLTSARRDALQIFMGGSDGAGFAIAWQEDPAGLRPGKFAGPGHGWSGATTNHKTDIWYSYITTADFRKIDINFISGGDPEHELDVATRPKALVPMSLPVRLSDNDTVNTDNLMVELGGDGYPVADGDGNWTALPNYDADSEGDGTHRYGYEIDGLCNDFYEFTNYNGDLKKVCITADGRLLDGNTGASRVNLFLQTYSKPDGTKSAWAIMNYEETKGAGIGPPDHGEEDPPYGDEPLPEQGKNVIYHSFDFQNPDLVSAGNIINLPERDADGNLMYRKEVSLDGEGNIVYGALILDYLGLPQLAYENARRARFILQGKAAMGASKTVMVIVYKEGQEGSGRPSDIFLRRVVSGTPGNPYAATNIVCNMTELADNGLTVCVDGTQNMSTVNPILTTESMGDPESDDPWGAVKVLTWEQTPEILDNASWVNPYEDARAHRGQIRGDHITMGYSYTPNWAAARNGNDKYDFYVRRSFDGGLTWTTDPAGGGVTHCRTWTDPVTKIKTEDCTTYPAGAFEEAHNLSQLPNAKSSVIEPRIVCPPGTIKVDGVWTGTDEDFQDKNVCYVAFGTSTNPKKEWDPVTGEPVQDDSVPMDLHYSFTQDRGERFAEVAWDVNPDSDGNFSKETVYRWDVLAKGGPEQGEVQLRSTPDGSRFYSCWLEEGEEGSDIMFRRIMSPEFPVNKAP